MSWASFKHTWYGCWPVGTTGFDGTSFTAVCAHCGYRILQDSHGQWFSTGIRSESSAQGGTK